MKTKASTAKMRLNTSSKKSVCFSISFMSLVGWNDLDKLELEDSLKLFPPIQKLEEKSKKTKRKNILSVGRKR